jgi:SCF-associated factor 1
MIHVLGVARLSIQSRCGRSFAVALDREGHIWTFVAWGIPYRLVSPLIAEGGSPIVEIECGWDSACALTERGDVFFWRPLEGDFWDKYDRKMEESEAEGGTKIRVFPKDRVVKCQIWEVSDVNPIPLPPIPMNLPALREGSKHGLDAKLVKIASGQNFLIGLTNGGHVLGIDISRIWEPSDRATWIYVGIRHLAIQFLYMKRS